MKQAISRMEAGQRLSTLCRLVPIVALLWFLNIPDIASAVNTGFLPGDACFGSQLSFELLDQFNESDSVTFEYRGGAGAFMACGYAGYWNLTIDDMSDKMKTDLRRVYKALREEYASADFTIWQDDNGGETRHERNPFSVVIYNKSYDVSLGIGLKLNEDWMDLIQRSNGRPALGAYSPFITDYRAIAKDWRLGPIVSGLKIKEADAKPFHGARIEEPVSIESKQIQILIFPDQMPMEFAFGAFVSEEDGGFFYRVTEDGIQRCHWNRYNDFVSQPWPLNATAEQLLVLENVVEAVEQTDEAVMALDGTGLSEQHQRQIEALSDKTDQLLDSFESLRDELRAIQQALQDP